ncbi:MAG: FIST N-terminal domain-containing protein [Pseudomonadota bacterium]
MGISKRLEVRQAHTQEPDADRAVTELCEQLDSRNASVNILFCSPKYDLERLGRRLAASFSTPIIGCTSAGQLGQSGFQKGGITAVSLTSDELRVAPYLIAPLAQCQERASEAAFAAMSGLLERGSERAFGVVLTDALSQTEERLAASLYQSLGAVPLIGGSAGDDLQFDGTFVYHDGRFRRDAALFTLFETSLPFTTFKVQHAVPGRHKLVVTLADPEQRVVLEFNGEPAAEAYAEALGTEVAELNSLLFSKNPLMLNSGGDHYVRAVRRVNSDQSLAFFCALEEGLVLTIGEPSDPILALQRAFDEVHETIGVPEVILGCDCVLRRLEFEHAGNAQVIGELMARNRVVGFNGYGEQYNAIYMNQTLSAVALGAQ